MNKYTIEYWDDGQYNYDLKVEAVSIAEALEKAPKALINAGHAGAVDRNEWQVLYND